MTSDNIYIMLKKLREMSSVDEKINHIKVQCYHYGQSTVKEVFLFSCLPEINYGVRIEAPTTSGDEQFSTKTWYNLVSLAIDEQLKSDAGKKKFAIRYARGLSYKSADVYRLILDKNLQVGLTGKDIERVWPGLMSTTMDTIIKKYNR